LRKSIHEGRRREIRQINTILQDPKRQTKKAHFNSVALSSLKNVNLNKSLYKLLCSFLFWTEGGKSTDSYVFFINSDQKMVATFLKLLRGSFKVDEKKLRAMVHIHEYHDEKQIGQQLQRYRWHNFRKATKNLTRAKGSEKIIAEVLEFDIMIIKLPLNSVHSIIRLLTS